MKYFEHRKQLQAGANQTKGNLTSIIDTHRFSTSCVQYYKPFADVYWLTAEEEDDWVVFCVPSAPASDGTRTVSLEDAQALPNHLQWEFGVDGKKLVAVRGSTTVTLSENHKKIEGYFNFYSEDGRHAYGTFNFENP